MTDLEREASEIVRGIVDACAQAEGYGDYLDSDWSVNQTPHKERIVALANRHATERLGSEERRRLDAVHALPLPASRRTTELL